MGEHDLHRHVEVSDSQGTLASADVTISQESDRTARASLRATAGHLTPGIRASLVDAVLDLPEVQDSARLEAAFPLGDSETLYRLRQRCQDVRTHPAGTTALVEANLGSGLAPGTVQEPACKHLPAVIAAAGKSPSAASKPAPEAYP